MSNSVHLPSFSLGGRVALVTGASRGIGSGLAEALAAAGATVAVTARSAEDARSVADRIVSDGGSATAHPLDVSDLASIRAGVESVIAAQGGSTSSSRTPGWERTMRHSTSPRTTGTR